MKLTIIARDPSTQQSQVVEADGVDYDTAKAAALAQIPADWQALSIRRL